MPSDIPTEKVIQLRSQGFSDNQVMEALQKEGYDTGKVSTAMQQADIKKGIQKADLKRGEPMPGPEMNPGAPQQPPMPGQPMPMQQQPMMQEPMAQAQDDASLQEKIEEVTEAIIDEKWEELTANIQVIIDWKGKIEGRIDDLEEKFNNLNTNFDKLHSAILDKVGEYDDNIRTVGTNIKALEQVFQKILPGFVENVNELSLIAEKIKKNAALDRIATRKKK